jgi:hypothetical protein
VRWSLLLLLFLRPYGSFAVERHVPTSYPTVDAALDAAQPGDVVVITAGVFPLVTVRDGIDVTIQGAGMTETVLDGAGGTLLTLTNSTVRLRDLTVFDGDDGINAEYSHVVLRRVRVTETSDGVDLDRGGSLVARDSEFVFNSDDGIDLDHDSWFRCERCIVSDNGDDGIEVKTHGFVGPPLISEVAFSRIERNEEAGFQLIEKEPGTARSFHLHDVVIADNWLGGFTWQCCGDTDGDLDGYPGDVPVLIERATIIGNGGPGVEGGASGFMEIRDSILWQNAPDLYQVGGPIGTNLTGVDPLFSTDHHLSLASPAVGAGESGGDLGAYPLRACSDGSDNDGDGAIDLADGQCTDLDDPTERPLSSVGCGIGPELLLLVALLARAPRRASAV